MAQVQMRDQAGLSIADHVLRPYFDDANAANRAAYDGAWASAGFASAPAQADAVDGVRA